MIETLEFRDYCNIARCDWHTILVPYTSREAFPSRTLTLRGGNVYGFLGKFGMGAWAWIACIAGRAEDKAEKGQILLDGKVIDEKTLQKISCLIPEPKFGVYRFFENRHTVSDVLHAAVKKGKCPFTAEELKEHFQLTDERFDRRLAWTGIEMWRISMAIDFALGKDVFCFPWMNGITNNIPNCYAENGTLDFLREQKKIVLIASDEEDRLALFCDTVFRIPE